MILKVSKVYKRNITIGVIIVTLLLLFIAYDLYQKTGYSGVLQEYEILIFHNSNQLIDEISVGFDRQVITEHAKGFETITFVLDAGLYKEPLPEGVNFKIKSGSDTVGGSVYYFGHAYINNVHVVIHPTLGPKVQVKNESSTLKDRQFYKDIRGMVVKKPFNSHLIRDEFIH